MSWYSRDPSRAALEQRAIEQTFPGMRFKMSGTTLLLEGVLRTAYGRSYTIHFVFPDDYPYSAPKAYVPSISRSDVPHRFRDGSLCIQRNEWSPSYTSAVIVGWAAHWLHAYEIWDRTREWPGKVA